MRDMLSYYSTQYAFNHAIDELIAIMKPRMTTIVLPLRNMAR